MAVEAAEELWPGFPSGVFQRPHCSLGPSSCHPNWWGSLLLTPFWRPDQWITGRVPQSSLSFLLHLPFSCGSLGVAPGPSREAFSLMLEEERWSFPTWMDRCVSPCWGGYPILLGKKGKRKLSLVYKCSLYRTRRVVPKILSPLLWGFPGGAGGKEPTCQCRRHKRLRFDPWIGKIPWRRAGNPLHYSCLENPMDRGAWQAAVHRVAQSQTGLKRLSMHALSKQL